MRKNLSEFEQKNWISQGLAINVQGLLIRHKVAYLQIPVKQIELFNVVVSLQLRSRSIMGYYIYLNSWCIWIWSFSFSGLCFDSFLRFSQTLGLLFCNWLVLLSCFFCLSYRQQHWLGNRPSPSNMVFQNIREHRDTKLTPSTLPKSH